MRQNNPRPREDRMGTISTDAVRQFSEQGYYAPIRALTSDEAANLRSQLEAFETDNNGLTGGLRNKPHLLLTWLDGLVRHPGVLDSVEQVIGPNILAWGQQLLHQGTAGSKFCLLAPGFHLLGLGAGGYRYGLGGPEREQP